MFQRERTKGPRRAARGTERGRAAAVLLSVLLCAVQASGGTLEEAAGRQRGAQAPPSSGAAPPGAADGHVDLLEVLARHNANIRRAIDCIDTLRVEQEMLEPQPDGTSKRGLAVLTYGRSGAMRREELSSNLGYPAGSYSLLSLIGPELSGSEYAVELVGTEEMEGRECYRLKVTALKRDADHFDGDAWIETTGFGLVRLAGEVADAPFPLVRITLDKAFEPGPGGFWLLRRRSGEAEAQIGFIRRSGRRHVFYYDYLVGTSPDGRCAE